MSAIRRVSLSEQVFNSIVHYTQEHGMQVGDKLPTEGEFAELFQVSRTSVREATKALGMNGAVESIPGKGTFIRQPMLNYILNDCEKLVLEANVSIAQIMEVRTAVELLAADLAIERSSEADIARVADALEELRQAIHAEQPWAAQDANFHVRVAECAKNPLVVKLVESYSDTMRKYLDAMVQSKAVRDLEQHIQEHEGILLALRQRDRESVDRAVRRHLQNTQTYLLRLVDENSAIKYIVR